MKLISLTCPNCNANLDNIDPNLKQCYCQYCGTKIMLDDGTIRKETHIYDEAKIKETESKESIRLKELELEREREKEHKELGKKLLLIGGGLIAIGLILGIFLDKSTIPMAIGGIGGWVGLFGILMLFVDNNKKD